MKKCSVCGIEKNKSEFSKRKTSKDGLRGNCRSCGTKYYYENKQKYDEYREIHKQDMQDYNKEYCIKNKEALNEVSRNYYATHKSEANEYVKRRKAIDPLFKLAGDIRSLICITIRNGGFKKSSKACDILGCTFSEFYFHIESQFQLGMSWENRAEWHFDHIYPVSRALNEEHLIALNHYTNFQPLWAADNVRKGNKLPENILYKY